MQSHERVQRLQRKDEYHYCDTRYLSVRFQLAQLKVNPSVMYVTPLFWTHQIKATLDNGYKNAVKNYNSTDSKNPVDTIQRNVSGRFSITLVALHLSDFMFLCTHQRALVYMNILKGQLNTERTGALSLNHVALITVFSKGESAT